MEGGVRLVLCNQGPGDATYDLERQVGDDHCAPVFLGHDSIHYERSLQLEEAKVRILREELRDGELKVRGCSL